MNIVADVWTVSAWFSGIFTKSSRQQVWGGWEEFLLPFSQHIAAPCLLKNPLSAILLSSICNEIAPSISTVQLGLTEQQKESSEIFSAVEFSWKYTFQKCMGGRRRIVYFLLVQSWKPVLRPLLLDAAGAFVWLPHCSLIHTFYSVFLPGISGINTTKTPVPSSILLLLPHT